MRATIERISAGIILLILTPLLMATAIAIVIESGWPFLFRQTRVGRGGRAFSLVKLRSMRSGTTGTPVTAGGDRRVTAVGKILRKYKLDELPQLWNVLIGDMQFIGPRPEVPQFVDSGDPVWVEVLRERPGLTDLSTLVYRNEEELLARATDPMKAYAEQILPRKNSLSASYRRARSFRADCKLLLLTARYSLFPSRFDADRIVASFLEQK